MNLETPPIIRPALNKVTITSDKEILINGLPAGFIGGTRSEVWIHGYVPGAAPAFVARMKYCKPGTKARRFIKAVFSVVSMPEYLALLSESRSPRDVADALGVEY